MIIYIDENMPPQLADGLDLLQAPENIKIKNQIQVRSIQQTFGIGALDEDWIPKVGEEDACVITQDININRSRHQRELYLKHGVGIFFLRAPSKSGFKYWDFVKLIIKKWDEITRKATKTKRPFAFRITSQGRIEEM